MRYDVPMMSKGFWAFLFFLLLQSSSFGATVVVIQGNNTTFGRRYFCGFTSAATERISAFQYEAKKEDALISRVKKLAPDLIFTLGEAPVEKLVALLPSTPFLVGGFHSTGLASKPNFVTLEKDLPIGAGLTLAQALFPNRKTVGTIYNPAQSADTFQTLVTLTGKMGLKIASLKVDSPSDVKAFISAFAGKVDLLYWIRDSTTATDTALDETYKFAQANNIPVISTDPSHLEKGALLSIGVDPFAMGEEAWKTAQVILKEGKIPKKPVSVGPGQMMVSLSLGTANHFGVDTDTLQKFLQTSIKENYSVKVLP